MRKTIKVGELRQNPTPMLDDIQNGDEYVVTNHARPVARILPLDDDQRWRQNRDQVVLALRRTASPELAALVAEARVAERGRVE